MNVLAIDTATERCSAALQLGENVLERSCETARAHGELLLPMIAQLLGEAGLSLAQLDGIAYGRGPGGFTGVRMAVSVAQGLALGADLPTVGVSNLAAVAQQVARPGDRVLVCMDARMGEVYCGRFARVGGLPVVAAGAEQVSRPEAIDPDASITVIAGTGLKAYAALAAAWPTQVQHPSVLPHAREIALLALSEFAAGRGVPAAQAQPVYLRDQVVARRM